MQPHGTVILVQLNPANTSSNENAGGTVAKETTSVNPLQLRKVSPPMLSNPLPSYNLPVNPLQLRKAKGSTIVTELGIVSEPEKPLQPQNAEVAMEATASPRSKLVKPLHL